MTTAVLDVYAGNQLQTHDPVAVAAVSFTMVTAFFLIASVLRAGTTATMRPWRVSRGDVVAINVMTAVCWLCTLYALKFLEPAIVSVCVFTLELVFTLPLSPALRPGTRVLRTEIAVAAGFCVLIGVLGWRSFAGDSAVGRIGVAAATAGAVLTVISALSGTYTVIYAKRLSEAGHGTQPILAVRFFALLIAAWAILAVTGDQRFSAVLVPSAVLAVAGIGLPIYLFQVGVGHTEPVTAELISSLSPVFVFAFQLLDPRLATSPVTLVIIVGIIVLVGIGTVARQRHDTALEATLAGTPEAAPEAALEAALEAKEPVMICAIVDAYRMASHIAPELRRLGVRCVHVESGLHEPGENYQPADFHAEFAHTGDVAATAALLRAAGTGIVVAGNESGVLLADLLSAELGTPGNGMSRPAARRDKHEMVLAVAAAGLRTAESFASPDAAAVAEWARGRPWPVVLKPVTSAGGDNVYTCRTPAQIRASHARIMAGADLWGQRNTTVLAQQRLAGDEYFVNTVSAGGKHHVVEVWRYQKRELPGRQICYDYECPVPPGEPVLADLTRYALDVLDALEIRNGAAHTEIIVGRDGPVLVECGARLGGSHVPALVTRCLGTNQVEQLALAIARPELVISGRLPGYRTLTHVRYVTLFSPYAGVVPSAQRLAPVRALKSLAEMVLYEPAGTPFGPTVDVTSSPGHLYLCSDDPAQVADDYNVLRDLESAGLYAD